MLQCNRFDASLPIEALPQKEGSWVTYSSLHDCEVEQYKAATYSIKYVLQGTEHYFLHGKKFSVSAGNFLLVNNHHPIDFFIRSRKKVNGFCIHLEERLLQEIYAGLLLGGEQLIDTPFEKPVIPPFEEILYSDKENNLGGFLRQMADGLDAHKGTIAAEPAALYYHLSQHLLQVQNSFPKGTSNLGIAKNSTRKELFRRLEVAKELLDVPDMEPLNINAIAQQCALSGSHLFRSFKKLYGISPYQYQLQQKVKKAALLLRTNNMPVTDVALLCGFADLSSFSRAFKKVNGQSPTSFLSKDFAYKYQ